MQDLALGDDGLLIFPRGIHGPEVADVAFVENGHAIGRWLRRALGFHMIGEARDFAFATFPEQGLVRISAHDREDVVAFESVAHEEQYVLAHPGQVLFARVGFGDANGVFQFAIIIDERAVDFSLQHEGHLLFARGEGVLGGAATQALAGERVGLEVAGHVDGDLRRLAALSRHAIKEALPFECSPGAVARDAEVLNAVFVEMGQLHGLAEGCHRFIVEEQVLAPEVGHAVAAFALVDDRLAVGGPVGRVIVAVPADHMKAFATFECAHPDVAARPATVVFAPPVGEAALVGDPFTVGADLGVESVVADDAPGAAAFGAHREELAAA